MWASQISCRNSEYSQEDLKTWILWMQESLHWLYCTNSRLRTKPNPYCSWYHTHNMLGCRKLHFSQFWWGIFICKKFLYTSECIANIKNLIPNQELSHLTLSPPSLSWESIIGSQLLNVRDFRNKAHWKRSTHEKFTNKSNEKTVMTDESSNSRWAHKGSMSSTDSASH